MRYDAGRRTCLRELRVRAPNWSLTKMAWLIFVTLMLFYVLGLFVFHATGPIHLLPFVAVAVPLIDHFLVRSAKKP